MKSFFKKLAFVMALAMVVSLAAPAATANAATALKLAEQESKTVVSQLTLKADTTQDLCFVGAPSNWKSLNPTWKSSNEAVATVNKNGVVAGVKEGYAVITFTLDGIEAVSVPVFVGTEMTLTLGTAKDETFTETALDAGKTLDLNFYGITNWAANKANYTCVWVSSNEDVATVDKLGVVTAVAAGTAKIQFAIRDNNSGYVLVAAVDVVVPGAVEETEFGVEQKTATKVEVEFTNEHSFDATGTEGEKTLKVYRVFSTEEMAKMPNTNGLKLDAEGNGYQAYYVMNTYTKEDGVLTTWVVEGYDAFVDGAKYAVVYGKNETSSTINGIVETFTAWVGKVHHIDISATEATVENDIEPSVAAVLTTRLFNSHGIDITDYWKNADETDYELVTEDMDVSVSGNEVTFDEAGRALVKGTYTFYDEEKEEDVLLDDTVEVVGKPYSTYRIESIVNWTLKSGYKNKWSATTTEMIAGDSDELYVIIKDNRGNYYSNVPGIEETGYKINGVPVLEIGDGDENTAFEQYGYELVFDSLDPDSLLVDELGYVESYKRTNSFALVAYKNRDIEDAKLHEIGVMGIKVNPARKLDSVNYKNGTSFTVLETTEAEDGVANAYADYADFNLTDELKVEFLNQYGKAWGDNAEDFYDVETNFDVTTTKEEFKNVAEDIADALNAGGVYEISSAIFAGTNTTSVSFKIKESATADSTTVTIRLDKPKYVLDPNDEPTDEVYVDPTRAIITAGDIEMYLGLDTAAKLFQVSKANQKIGYFRIGALEDTDEKHGYYVANDLTKNFVVKAGEEIDFVTDIASSSAVTASGSALKTGDYVLVVTDPTGKVFPAQGFGGNNKSFGADSKLGIVPKADNTGYDVVVAAVKDNDEMEYAVAGTYRTTVYKITSIVENKNTNGEVVSTKYNTSRVSSDSFVVSKDIRNVSFYHQETTKDVELSGFTSYNDILQAISETMTFKLNGVEINVDTTGATKYKSYQKYDDPETADYDYDYHYLDLVIDSVDYKIQNNGQRAVINTVTFKVYTPAGGYYLSKVKVNRSVNATE